MKLTAKTTPAVKLPHGKTDHIEWDGDLAGFGLRLRASGDRVLRTYVAQYRAHGHTRRVRIGAFEKLSTDEARKAAKKVLAQVEIGGDPQAERRARRAQESHTLKSIVAMFLEAKKPIVRPNTFRELTRYLCGPYFRPLHATPIDHVSRRDVAIRVAKIVEQSGSPTARRARAALSAMYVWALGHGLCETNPVVGTIAPEDSKSRDRVLSSTEIAAIWRACGDDAHGRIVKLLLLTGCRRTEICGLRWSEIDESGVLRLPPERTKNGRAHALPLPALALDIIASIPRVVGRDHLFGERSDLGFTQWGAKRDLDAKLGNTAKSWTLHDLRRTAATGMADIGVQPHIIEAVLNHISGHKVGVAGIYNRSSYEREVKAALALWADHVRSIVEGGERKVVPMQRVL
jgi:integrase